MGFDLIEPTRFSFMTTTDEMIEGINGFLMAMGEEPLALPENRTGMSEIEALRHAKAEYTRRLLKKEPRHRLLPPELIPDGLLQALRNREAKLKEAAPEF